MAKRFLLILIFGTALFLRLYQLDRYPVRGETDDEYYWTFLGTSLLQNQKPISWSDFDYPRVTYQTIGGTEFRIVSPNMDLPPLFSIIPGTFQTILGRTWDNPLPLAYLRLPMVALGMLNLFLFYLVVKSIFATKLTILATALFATTPSIVFGSRLVVSDNLLMTLMLVFMLISISAKEKTYPRWLTFMVSGVCLLTKLQGIAIVAGFVLWSMEHVRKYVIPATVGALTGGIVLLLYAWHFGLNTFLSILSQQASYRVIGFASFPLLFLIKPAVTDRIFLDGVVLAGTIGLLMLLCSTNKVPWMKTLAIFSLAYILMMAFTAGEMSKFLQGQSEGPSLYGWYKFPLYPAFIISLTWLSGEIHQNYNKLGLVLLSLFLCLQLRLWLFNAFDFSYQDGLPSVLIRGVLIVIGSTLLLPKVWWRYAVLALMLLTIVFSTLAVVNINPDKVFADTDYLLSH